MTDPAADPISSFYDDRPYPPPVEHLDGEAETWADGLRRRVEHSRLWPTLAYRDDHTILVAGCGTTQAVRYALRYPRSTVLGIDVSSTSIDASRRLVDHHQLGNVELHQLPIERVGELADRFDHVVCTGVLHHTADPPVALRALRDVLAPDGALHLMVYGAHGRHGIHLVQEYARRLGVAPTAAEIDALVDTLRELPAGHPVTELLRRAPDFADDDALADALLNPRDRSFTVPEVYELVGDAGLRFGRWFRQAPYRPQCGSMTETPHADRVAALPEPEQAAVMELFRGTMLRHALIAHRDDTPLPDAAPSWADDDWPHHIPVRPPTVIEVEERLPPGVAGALINRAHVDRDLVCFVDAAERAVFSAVDGATPLGRIPGVTVELFRRWWWHDLVMIDASRLP